MSCPDGSTVTNGNALTLLSCAQDGGTAGGLPGSVTLKGATSVDFSLINGAAGEQHVFTCAQ